MVGGPPPSSSCSRQCHDISNFPGAQGSLSKVDSDILMIKKVQQEHVSETESDCKTRSNFRALFYRVSRAFGCDQNVHVALVTRGARRSTRNLPYVTITHSYVIAFFATRFLLRFRSHFCRNCSFTRRYQHDSVLELFLHFGRRTKYLSKPKRKRKGLELPQTWCHYWSYQHKSLKFKRKSHATKSKLAAAKSTGEWGLCALRHGIQISMEAILACHPARSTE